MRKPHWVITYREGECGVKLILGSCYEPLSFDASRADPLMAARNELHRRAESKNVSSVSNPNQFQPNA